MPKHYTCACLSACGAPNTTPVHIRALKPHLDRHGPSENAFGHGCTVPACDTVERLHGSRIWSRRCACHDSNYDNKAERRFPIMATKPKRSLNSLELRLCMFGAAQTLWSYACACLVLRKCCSNVLELRLCMFGAPQDIKACNKNIE